MDTLTTTQAALELGVTQGRIRQYLLAGRLPGARRIGRDWHIPAKAIQTFQREKRGRKPRRARK